MSLREKAREVKAAGEAERGNFTPTGAPLRVYKYWASRSKNAPERENFCHFWRVVVFWAPFMAFRRGVEALFTNTLFLGAIGVLAVVGILLAGLTWGQFGVITLICLAVLYGLGGLLFGAVFAHEKYLHDKHKPYIDWEGKPDPYDTAPEIDPISKWGALVTLPVSWFSFALVAIADRLDKDTKEMIGGGFVALVMSAMLVYVLVLGFIDLGFWFLLVLGGIVLGFATLFGIVIGLGRLFESLRAHKRLKEFNKPAPTYDELAEVEPVEPREPGRVSKFFTAIADFLILATQVVRVNKWKICPLVTIEEKVDA